MCGVVTVDTGQNPGIGIYILRGECLSGDPVPSTEGILEWVPFNEISRLHLVEDLYTLLPRVVTMQSCDPPFAAHLSYDAQDQLVITFG
jgi:hypothetical protein